jgi:hypothetical protein
MKFQTPLSRFAAGAICAVLLSDCVLSQAHAAGKPPAQGPPAASLNFQDVPVAAVSGMLLTVINAQLAIENAALAKDPSHQAVISASIQAQTPYMSATDHTNQPNQFLADVPFTVTYHVSGIQVKILGQWVPYPFDRDITQAIDVEATCEGWFTGSGALTYNVITYPPVLVGDHSFAEDAVGSLLLGVIPAYVDSVIRDALKSAPVGSTTVGSGIACRSLGLDTRAQGFPFDSINYDPPGLHRIGGSVVQQIQVRVTKVKRLAVRDSDGVPVYGGVEVPQFDFYAGNSHVQIHLPGMVEGQTFTPTTGNTAETPVPDASGLLVLISNLSSGNDDVNADYAFQTFGVATAFGNGTHTFSIPKHWMQPVHPGSRPTFGTAPGYEITVEVSTPSGQTTSQTAAQ